MFGKNLYRVVMNNGSFQSVHANSASEAKQIASSSSNTVAVSAVVIQDSRSNIENLRKGGMNY